MSTVWDIYVDPQPVYDPVYTPQPVYDPVYTPQPVYDPVYTLPIPAPRVIPDSPGPGWVWDDNLGWQPPESTYLVPGTGTLLPGLLPPIPAVKTEQIKKLLIGAAILLGIVIVFKGK